ncbi:DUF354 domain-containing protein [Halorientalis litorea]|jgi:predicted glycosyltransferase|uniref:DUF354 domain-containing protein n=1 Tax=Halorientalis litorea TaxID=2931977 RepID=UPI001FF0E1C1|nr:DUF354 domain-containing protein [Halorientalis litorea]
MRFLILVNTPAHVHLYRNLVPRLQNRGHDVLVLARDYGCTVDLLDYYDLPSELYGRQAPSFRSLVANVPGQFGRIARRARSFAPDVVFGRGAYAVVAGTATRTPIVLVIDSEPSQVSHRVSSRFARTVVSPNAFEGSLGDHHVRFDGLQECAYLHPEVFTPDPSVRDALGVGSDEAYALVRLNAFDALHDVGSGSRNDERRELIRNLAERATVFVSDEAGTLDLSALPAERYDIHPGRMHDALAEARLFVTDTGTMATEAGLLGTPTVRYADPDEPTMGEFEELRENDLLEQHNTMSDVVNAAERLLDNDEVVTRWATARDRYLTGTADLTALLVNIAEHVGDGVAVPADVSAHVA